LSPKSDKILPYFGGLFPDEPLPKVSAGSENLASFQQFLLFLILQDGFIDLPDRPGFGVTLSTEKLKRPYTRDGKPGRVADISAPNLFP